MQRIIALIILLMLSACAGNLFVPPVNKQGSTNSQHSLPPVKQDESELDETLISLSFSGGGMRASAFSYGVLEDLHNTYFPNSDNKLTDAVDIVTGVSGGSVTAAYYVWKGDETFPQFRKAFLNKNAEQGFLTNLSIRNIVRILTFGGLNDNSAFPKWLNDNVFHNATYGEVLAKGRPILWISASDIINRTPFVFSGESFAPLCSDLSKVKLADAVAASAAVPGAFTPINVESFSKTCDWKLSMTEEELADANEYFGLKTSMSAYKNYHDETLNKYIKLLDGGLTDNLGIHGLSQARMAQKHTYSPLSPERAIRLKRMLFLVVNSGRGPIKNKWGIQLSPPGAIALAGMITDTAIDANTRSSYDLLRTIMLNWRSDLVAWRCSLSESEVKEAFGENYDPSWKCDDLQLYVTQISFSDAGKELQERLDMVPTRFALPDDDIELLLTSAKIALQNDAIYQQFLEGLK